MSVDADRQPPAAYQHEATLSAVWAKEAIMTYETPTSISEKCR
jgi:hypothetical protein